MIELFIMLMMLAGTSFLAGVLLTRELCHMATEEEKEARK